MTLSVEIDDAVVEAFQRLIDAHGWTKTVVEYFAEEVTARFRQVVRDFPPPALEVQIDDLEAQKKTAVEAAAPSVKITRR